MFSPSNYIIKRKAATPKVVPFSSKTIKDVTKGQSNSKPSDGGAKDTEKDESSLHPKRKLERLFCGCKFGLGLPGPNRAHFGVGWTRAGVSSVSQLNILTCRVFAGFEL